MSMDNVSTPLVSIITPSYNQVDFIESTILSIKEQDYPNLQHIIIDGSSSDNTLEILEKYVKEYNMNWSSRPNKGQSDALNIGFSKAKGEIIGWLNSDDIYFDKKVISKVVKFFLRHPQCDVAYGDNVFIDKEGKLLKVECSPPFNYNRLLRTCYLTQPSVFLKKNVVEENSLNKSVKYVMDYEYWLRIGGKYKFLHIPKLLAGDRNYSDRRMVKKWREYCKESDQIRKQYGLRKKLTYKIMRIFDAIIFLYYRRLKGVMKLLFLFSKENFVSNTKIESFFRIIYRQLFGSSLPNIGLNESKNTQY